MIEVNNLFKTYFNQKNPWHVLHDISLRVEKGEIFGIIGKSGAGKSTLLKCLNLLVKPDRGTVIIDGTDLTQINKQSLRNIRRQIGVIFQGFNLLDSKTVFDNIALPLVLHKYNKLEIQSRVEELLHLVELTDLAKKFPASLSGGQKQRVGIARALATNPKILLSDEATSALDPQTTNSILQLLLDINEKLGLTIVLITHEIEVVRKICDKVAIIDSGKIVESGDTVDVILHPKNEITHKLILEEEALKYLEQVNDFYQFVKSGNNYLIIISFIGNNTFEPVLSNVAHGSGVVFSILHGELGRIKKMPFGQLLVEIKGTSVQLEVAFNILSNLNVHYEIIA